MGWTKGGVRLGFGVLVFHPAAHSHPLVSRLFLLTPGVQPGGSQASRKLGLVCQPLGNHWSLQACVKKGSIREGVGGTGRLRGDGLNWPPLAGFRCHVTASQVSQVWGWRVPCFPPPDSWTERTRGAGVAAWVASSLAFSYQYLPPAPSQLCCPRPPTRPGIRTGTQVGDGVIWVC